MFSIRTFLTSAILSLVGISASTAEVVTGAGATFPFPLYSKWANVYGKKEDGFKLNYQSIGSGGGIKQIKQKTVIFGATDKPLKMKDSDDKDSLSKIGLLQFPTVIGGVVPVVNIEGIKANELKLSKKVLADIFLGKIKMWNDPAIVETNKDLKLPEKAITVIHRADSSGTTFIFTDYLAAISPEWKEKVGADSSVAWPLGNGAKGNEGVASQVGQISGSIGYVEYSYSKQTNLNVVKLETEPGYFIAPTLESFQSIAQNVKWEESEGFYSILTNTPGKDSWPIAGATFILIYENIESEKEKQTLQVLKFFDWAFGEEGDKLAIELGYVPMPEDVIKKIKSYWKKIKDSKGNQLYK